MTPQIDLDSPVQSLVSLPLCPPIIAESLSFFHCRWESSQEAHELAKILSSTLENRKHRFTYSTDWPRADARGHRWRPALQLCAQELHRWTSSVHHLGNSWGKNVLRLAKITRISNLNCSKKVPFGVEVG